MAAFAELGVMGEIIRGLDEIGWMLPTPIQQEAIPLILGGGDVMGAAETGTGKTGAFGIPLIQLMHENLTSAAQPASGRAREAAPEIRMSMEDKEALFNVDASGSMCSATSQAAWGGGRANVCMKQGKYFFEVTCAKVGGTVRVGVSTAAGAYNLGTCANGFGYGGTAKKSNGGKFVEYGMPYSEGDCIGCYIDLGANQVGYTLNGIDQGKAFDLPSHLKGQGLYPHICVKCAAVSVNFGATNFKFAAPAGFTALAKAMPSHVVFTSFADDAAASAGATPLAIVLEPSRDLAEQTYQCLNDYKKHMPAPKIMNMLAVGGVDMGAQVRELKTGVHVVVGTPGRIEDLIKGGKLSCAKVRYLILDEADRLLETGNLGTIMNIFSRLNKSRTGSDRLQCLMFSATLHSPEIRSLAEKICQFPTWVDLKGKDSVPDTVYHLVVEVDPVKDSSWGAPPLSGYPTDEVHLQEMRQGKVQPSNPHPLSRSEGIKRLKLAALVKLVETLKMDHCLVFCRTNFDCDNLEKFLNSLGGGRGFRGKAEKGKENPYSCLVLAGWRSVEERRENLQAFKDGDVRFLIATDVAARGIDISGLPFVVNVTLPDTAANYIHRIGRVGRADKMGLAISLVATEKERVWFCQKGIKGRGPGGRAPPCDDTRDYEKGGNCVWYDETSLLKDVETLLTKPIERMGTDFKLRPDLLNLKFGEEKDNAASERVAEHLEQLRPVVQKLASIESQAQCSFLKLRVRFHQK